MEKSRVRKARSPAVLAQDIHPQRTLDHLCNQPLLLKLGGVSFRGVDEKWTVPLYCNNTLVHLYDDDYLNYIAHD